MMATSLRSFFVISAILLAASSASASCGDYLHVREKKSEPTKSAPKPCDGPHCSQRHLPPAPPAPLSTSPLNDAFCCVVSGEPDSRTPRVGWAEIGESRAPHFLPNEVFDPPR